MRASSISVFLGGTEEQRFLLEKEFAKRFSENGKRDPLERVKSDTESAILTEILHHLPIFLARYGVFPLPLTLGHFHIYGQKRHDQLKRQNKLGIRDKKQTGGWNSWSQKLHMAWGRFTLSNWECAVHEAIHAYAFQSCGYTKDNQLDIRRVGLKISNLQRKLALFGDLDEAVTEELTIRFMNEFFIQIPGLKVLMEELNSFRASMVNKERAAETCAYRSYKISSSLWCCKARDYAYLTERRKLWSLISEMHEKNEHQFSSKNEVFALFAQAAMSGRLLPLARLIRKTFGKEKLRALAEETAKI